MWGWIAFGVLLLVYVSFNRHMTIRAISLTEYIEYLLMNPTVYLEHRKGYRSLLETITAHEKRPVQVAHAAAKSIADIAEKLLDKIQVSNVLLRVHREEWKD
jgi:hypothetical protein